MTVRMPLRNSDRRRPTSPAAAPTESSSVAPHDLLSATDPPGASASPPPAATPPSRLDEDRSVDLERLRDQLTARVAELQWDLGGLVYEMAIRDRIRVEVLVRRAAVLQDADAELGEVERILRTEQTGTAGTCTACGAPHSSGAVFCWQCGQSLLEQVSGDSILAP